MRTRIGFLFVAVLFAAFTLIPNPAQADTFGSGTNTFVIDFVNIGNTGNAADNTGFGAVSYQYRIGTYEISQGAIDKAKAGGLSNVTGTTSLSYQPAENISWYEAAAFVNWLNTNSGYQAAYNLTFSGSWSMALWNSTNAWTIGGTNLYRHKNAYYFLPSENEWYKAAYYNPSGSNYFDYPTGSDNAPTVVAAGTNAGTAVYNSFASVAAPVTNAGGLSPYGTMAQGGNVWEWNETAFDASNNSPTEDRTGRGGYWGNLSNILSSGHRQNFAPSFDNQGFGFRVASVPEPSTYALLLMTGAGALWWMRRRR